MVRNDVMSIIPSENTPMLCTRNLSLLPSIDRMRTLSQSLAMLDAILCPEWQYRFYSFTAHWAPTQALASMRNGSGDWYVLLFTPAGAIMKGFAHEAPMSPYAHEPPQVWPGILDAVPQVFAGYLAESAFVCAETTFCIWRRLHDSAWQCGALQYPDAPDPDGSAHLLAIFDGNPRIYHAWAEDYYERPISFHAVAQVYQHHPLTEAVVTALNDEITLADLQEDINEIQYPAAAHPS